jgi:hypothetical protein
MIDSPATNRTESRTPVPTFRTDESGQPAMHSIRCVPASISPLHREDLHLFERIIVFNLTEIALFLTAYTGV